MNFEPEGSKVGSWEVGVRKKGCEERVWTASPSSLSIILYIHRNTLSRIHEIYTVSGCRIDNYHRYEDLPDRLDKTKTKVKRRRQRGPGDTRTQP